MNQFKEQIKDAICNNDIAFMELNKDKFSIDERFEDENNDTLLLYSISDENSNAYEFFLKNHADTTLLNDEGENIIHSIVYSGKTDRFKGLLDSNNIDQQSNDGSTPLALALALEREEMALYLINNGASVNIADREHNLPIHLACYFGNLNIVEALIEKGTHLNSKTDNGNLPFALAVNEGHDDVVRFLFPILYP